MEHIHSRYVYQSLRERGIIRRATITIEKLPIRYVGIIQKEIIDEGEFRKKRTVSLKDLTEERDALTNWYILGGDIANPGGSLLFIPVINAGELEARSEKLQKANLGINIKMMIVTSILFGALCYRKFDVKHSRQYAVLSEEYGVRGEKPADYELTGKAVLNSNKNNSATNSL